MPSLTSWIMSRLVAEIRRKFDLDRPLGADRIDLAVLQRAQQLDLRLERQLADLVEEQRAAVGLLELADALVDGAGEGALLVAEQDALDQVLGDGAAVDDHERLRRRSLSPWMARAISSLPTPLSPSIRTGMLEAAARRPSAIDPLHGLAAQHQIGEVERAFGLLLDARDLALQRFDLEGALDRDLQALGRRRLDDEIDGAGAHGVMAVSIEPCAVCTMTGGLAGVGAMRRSDLHAVHARHDEVEQHEGDGAAVGSLAGSAAPARRPGLSWCRSRGA